MAVALTDPPRHYIKACEPSQLRNFDLPVPVQDGDDRLWTITKKKGSLSIRVNGVEVRNLTFSDSTFRTDRCPEVYNRKIVGIIFKANGTDGKFTKDTASDKYREQPAGIVLSFLVK